MAVVTKCPTGAACTVCAMAEGAGTVTPIPGDVREVPGDMRQVAGERDTSAIAGFWAVVPAGGAGTRLWPLSRSRSPKFLHDMTGAGSSLLQATWDRLKPLCGDHIMVVTGVLHEAAVRVQIPGLAPANLVAELSLIHISEPTRLGMISYAVFCL